jgi:hypothetical protein
MDTPVIEPETRASLHQAYLSYHAGHCSEENGSQSPPSHRLDERKPYVIRGKVVYKITYNMLIKQACDSLIISV